MNKNRMILAVAGGVIAVAVLACAYLAWSAYAAKVAAIEGDEEEGTDGLETVVSRAQALSRKPIYPSAASVGALASNASIVVAWRDDAVKLASRGDKVFEATTPAAFKTFIVSDAKRLSALPGSVGGVLVKPDFTFGPFKDYISEGKMPAESALPELQRRWDDVATVVEQLAKCGIAELVGVEFKTKETVEEPQPDKRKRPNANRRAKRQEDVAEKKEPAAFTYVFVFSTRAPGFVKVLNALETSERFFVVEDFSFTREKDVISSALGGEQKTEDGQTSRRGRRGRRGATVQTESEETTDSALKNGIVTDPLLDDPFRVTLTLTIYDFRSLETDAGSEEEKK